MAPSHRRELPSASRHMQAAAMILAKGGVAVPATYEEEMPGYQPPAHVGSFWLNGSSDDTNDLRTGADYIMTPRDCPAWSDPAGPPPEQAYDARSLLVQWVVLQGGGTPSFWDDDSSRWLDEARGSERSDWVVETFDDLASCDLESIRLPWSSE
ncbi:hypothetical protein NOCA290004 [metagenome]|uniref:Uncharacterized protein n=1 Tax=metagenome TaxID=256318 RepID=A0A2P2CFP8_9ZZZZ